MAGRVHAVSMVLAIVLAVPAESHGTITRPAMRHNPTVAGGWCQWCQGEQQYCDPHGSNASHCLPRSPCWDATPGSRVSNDRFGGHKNLTSPDGSFWVDETGGMDGPTLKWCAGQRIPIHYMIFADHNGVYRWEGQSADPGDETEVGFKNFTPWRSYNNDPETYYYDEDGKTPLKPGSCKPGADEGNWSWHVESCRTHSWAKTYITIPDNMPLGRTVIRWLWFGGMRLDGMRVLGPEPAIFVNCVDVVIGAAGECPNVPRKDFIPHTPPLPTIPLPPIKVPPAHSPPQSSALRGHSHRKSPQLVTLSTPPPASPNPILATAEGALAKRAPKPESTCSCTTNTIWDGSFGQFTKEKDFCLQNFGGAGPYISGGGGDGANGGWSDAGPCKSGQYSFSADEGWSIIVDGRQAQGKNPYRAFAYAQFCHGKPYKQCWDGKQKVSFSVSFKTEAVSKISAYLKLLFWSDSGNIVGLIPPMHSKGNGKFRMVTFMQDDFPNSWLHEVTIEDETWYHLRVDFFPHSQNAQVFLDGAFVGEGELPVDMLAATNGPQMGVYSFDLGGNPWQALGFKLSFRDACIGEAVGQCAFGASESGTGLSMPVMEPKMPLPPNTGLPVPAKEPQLSLPAPEPNQLPALTPLPVVPQPMPLQQVMPTTQATPMALATPPQLPQPIAPAEPIAPAAIATPSPPQMNVFVHAPAAPPAPELQNRPQRPSTAASSSQCSEMWGRCGGLGWTGPTCCVRGAVCTQYSQKFYQCIQQTAVDQETAVGQALQFGGVPVVAASAPTSGTNLQPTRATGLCAPIWAQCGGKGWTGATCCVAGSYCARYNGKYQQCRPLDSPSPTELPPTDVPPTEAYTVSQQPSAAAFLAPAAIIAAAFAVCRGCYYSSNEPAHSPPYLSTEAASMEVE